MALESGIQLKESGIPVCKKRLECGIQALLELRVHSVQARIQNSLGLPLRGDHLFRFGQTIIWLFETLLLNEEVKVILVLFCLN